MNKLKIEDCTWTAYLIVDKETTSWKSLYSRKKDAQAELSEHEIVVPVRIEPL